MVTSLVVWGALPFVAITVYAALSQVPRELIEAAQIDGARSVAGLQGRDLPRHPARAADPDVPSILWDFGVFTQAYLLIGQPHILPSNYLMSIYLFEEGYFKNDYGRGAAISILMLCSVALLSLIYVRRMLGIGEVDVSIRRRARLGWNLVGFAVFVVMVFPVFWMISTAFKTDDQINSLTPTWFPLHPTLEHFSNAIHQQFFWSDVKNTRHRRASRSDRDGARVPRGGRAREVPLHGRKLFMCSSSAMQMIPGVGLIIPLYVVLATLPPGERAHRRDHHLRELGAAVLGLDAARFPARHPEGSRGGRDGRRQHAARRVRPHPAPARRARPRRDLGLRVHHELERVHLRAHPANDQGTRRSRSGSRTSSARAGTPTGAA